MRQEGPSCVLDVKVTPRSSRNCVEVGDGDSIRVWLTASPTDGQANQAACELLAASLSVGKSAVELVAGQKARQKKVRVTGLSLEEALSRLRKG